MVAEDIQKNIEILLEIKEDASVPKNVKDKITHVIDTLQKDHELSIKIHKVMHELDEIAEDINLESYTRTLIWNVASKLEKMNNGE